MIAEESTWMKPRENWDPKLVWVLKEFLANEGKWDKMATDPGHRRNFKYWSPRFYVVQNDQIVAVDFGIDGWLGTIRPTLAKLVGN